MRKMIFVMNSQQGRLPSIVNKAIWRNSKVRKNSANVSRNCERKSRGRWNNSKTKSLRLSIQPNSRNLFHRKSSSLLNSSKTLTWAKPTEWPGTLKNPSLKNGKTRSQSSDKSQLRIARSKKFLRASSQRRKRRTGTETDYRQIKNNYKT